jgi:hypothetical protein
MIKNFSPLRVRRWSTADGEVLRLSETALELKTQLASVHYYIYELKNNGTYSTLEETQVNRFFLIQEMENLLSICSFKPVKWYAGYAKNEIIDDQTWHVVAVVRSN